MSSKAVEIELEYFQIWVLRNDSLALLPELYAVFDQLDMVGNGTFIPIRTVSRIHAHAAWA